MNTTLVKEALEKISETVSFTSPPMGWYFSPEELDNTFVFQNSKRWVCIFMYLKQATVKGKRIRFSDDEDKACPGIAELGGFRPLSGEDGKFIGETERFKKSCELAQGYYRDTLSMIHPPKEKYVYFEKIESIDDSREIEVVNLFPDAASLASLVVLAHYDRESNMDNVIVPFASGCESAFTVPYHEQFSDKPRCVLGLMDHLVRKFVPKDMILFSLPTNRLLEMANNIEGSFLDPNFENPTSF